VRPLLLAAALLALAPSAPAADLPADLPALEKEAEEQFRAAGAKGGNPVVRDEARRRCGAALRTVVGHLEGHWESAPKDRARIEERLARAAALLHWIRKESPVGLLDGPAAGPLPGTGAPPPSSNPFDTPSPGVASGPAPATLDQAVAAAAAWERDHRPLAAGAFQRWIEILAKHPERWIQEPWMRAAAAAGKARIALEDVYRRERDEDPDLLAAPEPPEVVRLLLLLGREIGGQDSSLRERAARVLAHLGAGDAVPILGKAARAEKEPQARLAMIEALADVGGMKGARELGALRNEAGREGEALDGLLRMAARNPVDRRYAVKGIGACALVKDEATAARAVAFLIAAGPDAARGLEEALATPSPDVKVKVMEALAATKDPRTARALSNFLLTVAETPGAVLCRDAARAAVKALGEPAVPFLFPALRSPRTRICTGELLREITGAPIGSGMVEDWISWWKRKHPDWREE
jgi:hypothetical protein